MRLALVADTFPPLRTSGAVQLRDLARELVRQGHTLTVLLPSWNQKESFRADTFDGVEIWRLKSPQTKDINYLRRTLAEFWMPFAMRRSMSAHRIAPDSFDGVIWYSPSIFHGPLVSYIMRSSRCPSYLIIRDIFPEWAVDMGLMSRSLPYLFFKSVARYQYSVAGTIGFQTDGNRIYFEQSGRSPVQRLEVMKNWLGPVTSASCSIQLRSTCMAGRKVFVYAGNMGVAQDMDVLLALATAWKDRVEVGFLFVGRGSEVARLVREADRRGLKNVLFHDEIDPDEIPALYAQCHVGLLSLDQRHKSHNIPGKFLTYIQCGLPVLARVNPGNDLVSIINAEAVGRVCDGPLVEEFIRQAELLLLDLESPGLLSENCRRLFAKDYSVVTAATQVVNALAS